MNTFDDFMEPSDDLPDDLLPEYDCEDDYDENDYDEDADDLPEYDDLNNCFLNENIPDDDLIDEDPDEDRDDVDQLDGHRNRIRLQINSGGISSLSSRQALEFMLYYVLPRQDVSAVAKILLEQFGDLRSLFSCGLDDFLRIEGLGDIGAHWLDMISKGMRSFASLTYQDNIRIFNHRQLLRHARKLQSALHTPCCVQLITDHQGFLMVRRPVSPTVEWAGQDSLNVAVDDASAPYAENAYLLIYTDDHRRHPSSYDRENIHKYAFLMHDVCCTLQDVLFISRDGYTSMRRLNMIPDVFHPSYHRRRMVSEDEMENLQDKPIKVIIPASKN